MADWEAPLPPNDTVAGDPGHPQMHNEIVDAIAEVRTVVDGLESGGSSVAWDDVTGKPAVIGAGATEAAARAAIGAGTSSLALGTGGTQAAAGNHTHAGLMTGSAAAIADSAAEDVAALLADFNALLAALRTRGVIS